MKNWKTTLVGVLLAVVVAIQPIVSTGIVDWGLLVIAALIAALGVLAKDFNVTGTTTL